MHNLKNFTKKENEKKIIFTAGPASLISTNLSNIKPCFGRGDKEYLKTEKKVLNKIKKIAGGFENIARFQGSGSLAIEIMMANYLFGLMNTLKMILIILLLKKIDRLVVSPPTSTQAAPRSRSSLNKLERPDI